MKFNNRLARYLMQWSHQAAQLLLEKYISGQAGHGVMWKLNNWNESSKIQQYFVITIVMTDLNWYQDDYNEERKKMFSSDILKIPYPR